MDSAAKEPFYASMEEETQEIPQSFAAGSEMCANPNCVKQGVELVPLQTCCDVYYSLHKRNRRSQKICLECLETAEKFREECMSCMQEGRSLLHVPLDRLDERFLDDDMKPAGVETMGDDEMNQMCGAQFSKREIASIVNDVLVSSNLQSQLQLCRQKLSTDIDNITAEYKNIEDQIREMELEVDRARNMYYESRPKFFQIVKTRSIDIDQNGRVTVIDEENIDDGEASQQYTAGSPSKQANSSETDMKFDGYETEEVSLGEWVTAPQPAKRVLFETPAKIPKVMPKVGDKVYAMKKTALCGWTLGEVDEVIPASGSKPPMFKIKFTTKKRKFSNEGESYNYKELCAKQLAYNIPCPFVLPVGTRIIGLFKDDCAVDEGVTPQDSLYYAGIVAEPPKNTNKYRYLIFFDDGYAQYVEPTEVLLVCESSVPVWADVHPDSQEFIKQYVQKYPERPMVRLTEGTMLSTEWSGKWLLSRVVEVDCSLAKMHFPTENRFEWIYRGSTRLSPLYESEKRNAARSEKNAMKSSSNRALPKTNRENNLKIEYLYGNEDAFQDKLRAVAKKSTASGAGSLQKSQSSESIPRAKPVNAIPNHSFLEFEGKMARITLPSSVPTPKEYEPHECSSSCVIDFDESNPEFRKLNPLAIIFYLGWGREVTKGPRRQVFYRTPCGARLRDFPELHEYLLQTNFSLSIDHFTFDANVDCLTEFQASRILFRLQDISYGKEIKPVQAINSLDHDYPDYVEYTSERIRGKGVPLELDRNFLVCCDCTDDCQDKLKCACWNLTYEGYRKTREVKDLEEVGYSYRRLKDHIVSGIYECNVGCKCRKTCLNRVAQNKMKWILQVFKTSNKGWAIRPLHDIPEGSFICVYAGQILTEQGANEDGKNFGDEYLAELDFIEVCEKYKEGYEESCIEPETPIIDLVAEDNQNAGQKNSSGDDEDSNDGSRRAPSRFTAKFMADVQSRRKPRVDKSCSTRDFYKEGEQCYIMDAKSIGNIGRYLNHCCTPNVYVQNVFVDTHDARFPWVAFFAQKTIRAGTEMTWDYNYDIGSVPEKTLYCQCGSPDCRGRLL